VLARLLERTGRDVVCVVRGEDPAGRIAHVLDDVLGVPAEQHARVRAVAGDVARPGVVADPAGALAGVDTVVHCAASIAFDEPLDAARRANVDGTRNVVALAGDRRLVHVSTTYVAGRRTGVAREDEGDVGQAFRNTYERTKLEAEQLVPPGAAIVRPSIVVGEAATGWTSAFNVLYVPLRAFARGLLREIPGDPATLVDVVPVDVVADAVVALAVDHRDVAGALHVASGAGAPTLGELAELAAAALGRPAPPVGAADLGVYAPYLDVRCVFDTTRADAVLGPGRVPPLAELIGPLVGFAEAAAWGKQPIRRVDAPASNAAA
jgi:long-chain acyl-CoA synthetase